MAAGDADAAAAFVRRFQRRVFGVALTVLGDQLGAEDVAQEAFVRAWRSAASYDPRRGAVLTWLVAITRNTAVDTLRLKRAEPLDPDTLAARLQATQADPQESRYEDHEYLRQAVVDLPAEQRRAVVLATYFGRTAREISDAEQIPLGTAKSRIRAGMMRLRVSLEVEDES